jgi:Xaa-Pro aminopeptidase
MTHALIALRKKMRDDNIDILLIPHNDRFKSEYIPEHEERLAWLSGFTGSWGFAIITHDEAFLFVDGRYTIQAPQQTDAAFWTIKEVPHHNPHAVLKSLLQDNQNIALESWRFTTQAVQQWQKIIASQNANLMTRNDDVIDGLWMNRPALPQNPAFAHDVAYAGSYPEDKISALTSFFDTHALDGYVVSDPGHLNWLLNIRGRDIAHMPIALCMGFITRAGHVLLFIDPAKIANDVKETWGSLVTVHDFKDMLDVLTQCDAQQIGYDGSHCPSVLVSVLKQAGKDVHDITSPLELARAIKNDTEILGSRNAHTRDAIAVINTWHWIDTHTSPTSVTELDVMHYLQQQRAERDLYIEDSFTTIAGAGPHGAIVHYHATPDTNRALDNDNLLLLDSGGQYRDGTTDITRTFAIGAPSSQMIADYTSVLQGHINLARTRFPQGTSGATLDILARTSLWAQGQQFSHGTGHGLGSFMGVHEGPQGFSPRALTPLIAGMFITNEPGYYKKDHYGIRLENVELVIDDTRDTDEQPMLAFEHLTLVPFEPALIDFTRLTKSEKNWLHDYHAQVQDRITPLLPAPIRDWFAQKCAPFMVAS